MTFGTNRGFTDHEHLDGIGLIHMNGRVYDPVIGRFLSPDPWIQDPNNSQSFNRYSYVWNNPLRYTDPTGEVSMDQAAEMGLIDTGSGCESDPSCKDVGNIGDDGASGSGKAGDTSTPEMGQQGGNENRDLQASGAETSGGAAENAQGNTTADSTNGSAVRQTQSAGAEGEAAQNLGAGAAPVSTENAGDAGRVDEEMVVYGRAQESSSSGSQEAHSSFIRGLIGKHLQGTLSVKAGFILAVTFKINVAPDGKVSVYTGGGLGAGLDVGAEAGMAANLIENDSADQDYQEGFTTDLSVSGGFGGHGSASFQAGEGGVTGGAGIGLGAGASMSVTIGYTWNF